MKNIDELPFILGIVYFLLWIAAILFNAVYSNAQTAGTAWIESITPPVSFPNYENVGDTARRFTFQDTQYVTIPYVHTVLPATNIRGASGYVSFVDGNNETSMIWVAGSVGSVSSIVPYVLIGSATTELEWVVMYDAADVTVTADDVSDLITAAENIGGVTRGTFAASSSEWRHNFAEGYRLSDLYTQALQIGGINWNNSILRLPRPYKPGQDEAILVKRVGLWSEGTSFGGFIQVESVEDIGILPDPIATGIHTPVDRITIGVLE